MKQRAQPSHGGRASQGDPETARDLGMDRRRFLQAMAAATGVASGLVAGAPATALSAATSRSSKSAILDLTAAEAVAALRGGDLKATHYAGVLLARARSLGYLNTVLAQDPHLVLTAAQAADERLARGEALGPLHGLPVLIKDNINTADLPTTAGTPALSGNRPRRNAVVVERLLAAGAIPFAKTNMHELALGVTSNNPAFGAVRNPYDPTKIPGGSSGGNASAVAAHIAPAGIGTDTAGSVRIPAALCGIAALRPTVGRYPRTGSLDTVADVVPISFTRDTPGPMARTVADVALLDVVIAGDEPSLVPRELAGVRLGVDRGSFFQNLDPETETVMNEALDRLEHGGAELVEVELEGLQALNAAVTIPVVAFELGLALPRYLAENDTGVTLEELIAAIAGPDVQALFALVVGPGAIPEAVYLNALLAQRPRLQALYADAFTRYGLDALVFPTTPLPARPIGQDATVELNGEQVPTLFTYIRHTDPGANAGIPGLTVPAGLTPSGLPVGLELDGPTGSDRALLAVGLALEQELGQLPAPIPRAGSV
jgi:Asp-tRNA(Asn)/Glu-tRNA(Gln) amidotransferase A subunit family amidase